MAKPHAIFTASDAYCGDFLVNHWLPSLCDHVTTDDVDINVLDYGLSDEHRRAIEAGGGICRRFEKDGHVACIQYRDIVEVIENEGYDQVLRVDGGDVIFQADIRPKFNEHQEAFRVALEQITTLVDELWMPRSDFAPDVYEKLISPLRGRPTINAGVIFAPGRRFNEIWEFFQEMSLSLDNLMSDQLMINHMLYRKGFVELDPMYTFVVIAAAAGYRVKDGVFYSHDDVLIPVVHNAGGTKHGRHVKNFGYGPTRNQVKFWRPRLQHCLFAVCNWWLYGNSGRPRG